MAPSANTFRWFRAHQTCICVVLQSSAERFESWVQKALHRTPHHSSGALQICDVAKFLHQNGNNNNNNTGIRKKNYCYANIGCNKRTHTCVYACSGAQRLCLCGRANVRHAVYSFAFRKFAQRQCRGQISQRKSENPSSNNLHAPAHTPTSHTRLQAHLCMYVCMFMYVCVCVCGCVCAYPSAHFHLYLSTTEMAKFQPKPWQHRCLQLRFVKERQFHQSPTPTVPLRIYRQCHLLLATYWQRWRPPSRIRTVQPLRRLRRMLYGYNKKNACRRSRRHRRAVCRRCSRGPPVVSSPVVRRICNRQQTLKPMENQLLQQLQPVIKSMQQQEK